MRLVALEREPFIDAVTGHPRSRQVSEALIDARPEGVTSAAEGET